MMKFSIVRIDKKRVLHLSVKTAEWFFERIKTDTKGEDIGGLRRSIAMFGDGTGYEQRTPVARIYPSVELSKLENGRLLQKKYSQIDIDVEAVKTYQLKHGLYTKEELANMSDQEIKELDTKKKVFLTAKIKILDAMEDIELPIAI